MNIDMFTQEQLVGVRNVFEESLKPFGEKMEKMMDEKLGGLEKMMDDRFGKLEVRMNDRFDAVHAELQLKSKSLDDQMTLANIRLCEVIDKLDSQEEQIADVSEQVTHLDEKVQKVQAEMSFMKGDMAILLDTTANMEEKLDEAGGTTLSLKDDMRKLKANSSIWVLGDSGDDTYTPSK